MPICTGTAQRHTGRCGQIKAQVGGLGTILTEELTPQAGNKIYTSSTAFWARSEAGFPIVTPDGLCSGGAVSPTNLDDEVTVAEGSAQIGGAAIAFSSATLSGLTRPVGAGTVVITAIHVDSTGTITATAGTEGAAGGARGAAGGPPYIPVDEVLLAYVTLSDTAAAPVASSEIDNSAAERAPIPSFQINYVLGQIEFSSTQEAIHTGDTPRKVYASYKFFSIVEVGDLFDWSLDITTDLVEVTAFCDFWKQNVKSQAQWSGSFNGYFVNSFWFDQAATEDAFWYIELTDDRDTTRRWAGFVHIDWSISVARDAPVTESITFTGIGDLLYLTS